MTTSPPLVSGGSLSAWTYEHDILGNRTRRNASTANHAHPMRYDWDVLNRATLIAQPSGGAGYAYRADGQRIEKVEGITFSWSGSRESGQYDTNYAQNRPTSRYYYDGQMGFEDDYNPSGTVTQVNRYILGARGIDRIARTESGNTTLAYPMYDGHGNMRALLTRDGTGYDTGNWKTYDVWGSVRSGGSSADPKQGYVASIGHVSDGESSLIYMRARCYEPATGRFISQDPAMDGVNWYLYCRNNPITFADESGCVTSWEKLAASVFGAIGSIIVVLALLKVAASTSPALLIDGIRMACYGVGFATIGAGAMVSPGLSMAIGAGGVALDLGYSQMMARMIWAGIDTTRMTRDIATMLTSASKGMKTQAFSAVFLSALYTLALYVLICQIEVGE